MLRQITSYQPGVDDIEARNDCRKQLDCKNIWAGKVAQ